MYKWELCGRFEHAETREQAATLLGATDPNEVRFAGYCHESRPMASKLVARATANIHAARKILLGGVTMWFPA